MTSGNERLKLLKEALAERILLLDGATGTAIQALGLGAADFGGPELEGCNENLVRTRPDLITALHESYLDAGADIIETDTFGATSVVLAEYGLAETAQAINRRAAALARAAADRASTAAKPRFVAGSMGPTTKSISVTGGVTFDALAASYREQAVGLLEGGADLLLLETVQDTLNCKAALAGIDQALAETGVSAAVAVSGTIETMGTLLAGQDIEAFYVSLAHRDLLWIGMNCATGPDFMTDHLRTLAALARTAVACMPNAGLPDENGRYHETPESFARKLGRFVESGWINVLGGCCGTTAEHIRLLAAMIEGLRPRIPVSARRAVVSGVEALAIDDSTRPVLVGERTNVLGSRKFKRLVTEGELEQAAELGRQQLRRGAHLLDVCLQDPDRNETADLARFLEVLCRKVKAPLMIDSTDPNAIEEALKRTPGKSIINSINLEEGEERIRRVVPLARRYGAALVVGCIDDDKRQAQAISRQRKLSIAERSFALLTRKYGVEPEDIIFDPLVFPAGTGDANYAGSAVETIEGIRLIKSALPRCKTVLGLSNVSFGLPERGREVLNAVMLHHCIEAGLDLAIVNSERLERYAVLPEEERRLSEDLLWWRGADPIAAFAAHFRDRASRRAPAPANSLPLEVRLARYVVEGSKDGLLADLDAALKEHAPLEIINGPLMKGMEEVGRLFNSNQMIVAEVLQSAEVMKAAVAHLQPHMERSEAIGRGVMLLATVKGDVHDIGKNLVDIILSNNGYRIINLGIKVPPEELIRAYREHRPDFIGLSGLLVKSAQMMVATVQDLKAAAIDCPVLVGGAALSDRFTRLKIAPQYDGVVAYANDAMEGLALANRLMDTERRKELARELEQRTGRIAAEAGSPRERAGAPAPRAVVAHDGPIPAPPDLKLHVLRGYDLGEIFGYINPVMLYTRHLGFRNFEHALAAGDPKAAELKQVVEEVQGVMLARGDVTANAAYGFFPAHSDGDRTVLVYSPDGRAVAERFVFGRQSQPPGLCLADYLAPSSLGQVDYLCLFVTTIGTGVRALAERWKDQGDYLRSHILQAVALESAEAFAELLHLKIRRMWGVGDPPGLTLKDLFQARYRGKRYSFGYPACPRLEDQAKLFGLLKLEQQAIGVRLTEGFMMDPESSVSALVLHHPQARYFSLSAEDSNRLERELTGEASSSPA